MNDPSDGFKPSLLLVEANESVRNLLTEVTAPLVSNMTVVRDGSAAMQSLDESQHFDIVLFDIATSSPHGIEIATVVRDKHPRTRIISMGLSFSDEEQNALDDLSIEQFGKPFLVEDLRKILYWANRGGDRRG